ncbi:MAG: glutamine synthetase III [Eubacteriales bacterium]|nr:glutamine synthetase III [Eubacteriales bacterium]MDD3197601.1 glutamine synthetase III [Eubacteriales bacterium]MDD4681875.1 glutamine synthetase III [Eubacteriales bacterium]
MQYDCGIAAGTALSQVFGSNVFNDSVMRQTLPKATYQALKKTIETGSSLDPQVAEVVASAMKDWAISKGATHFTHWFQPMTGITAEKHDSFISPSSDGKVIMEFSGKELIKGEPDASSFPSGGLRATFEARGYTAWDCTSPAFVKDRSLFIPTAFCAYTGEALDKKTPLLRSMDALSKQAVRVLHLLGQNNIKRVTTTVGPEQEYFLIDKKYYDQRLDLIMTGRTLFGAKPPKGQDLEDHYFGQIKDRIAAYMSDLDAELWKMGVSAKTKHNEVAPAQHELAPIFNTTNIATDHNQLTMETMKKVALRHGLVCLLHEKPFAGVNGSGKHNNWSMSTDDGQNLLEPGKTPHENQQFLLFLTAVIRAVDEYADLLRISAASPGNDHRLGANEAPPAIISIFLGDQLTGILEQIAAGKTASCETDDILCLGTSSLPDLFKDSTDRNRTSPFAFTGNKFEFRMVGSSQSIAQCNFTLNTIVAEVLSDFADKLEGSTNIVEDIDKLIQEAINKHQRVIFNGNGYSDEWVEEAKLRGLPNIRTTVDAIKAIREEKNLSLMEKHAVLSRKEMDARCEIQYEIYIKTINIEALTMIEMAKRQILPTVIDYRGKLASEISSIQSIGQEAEVETDLFARISAALHSFSRNLVQLERNLEKAAEMHSQEAADQAAAYRDQVFAVMNLLREDADLLETLIDQKFWPLPTYSSMLFNV